MEIRKIHSFVEDTLAEGGETVDPVSAVTSTEMIRPAPAMRAPWTADKPMPPAPKTATVEPGSILAVLNTAPTPVVTPHPISAARSRGLLGEVPNAFNGVTGEPHHDRDGLDRHPMGHLVHEVAALLSQALDVSPSDGADVVASRIDVRTAQHACVQQASRRVVGWILLQ